MTAVLTPPAPATGKPAADPRAPRRAIRRWAWRLLRREWRQQLLVIGLLVVAVAATVVGLGLVSNLQLTDLGTTGNATLRIDISEPGTNVAADVATFRQQFGSVEAIEHGTASLPGSVTPIDVRAQSPRGDFSTPMLRLVHGSYPSGPNQVAMTSSVATLLGVSVGDQWRYGGRPMRVVGIVENPNQLQDAFALVAPDQLAHPSSLTLLMNGSPPQRVTRPPGGTVTGIESTGSSGAAEQRNRALGVLLIATIGLSFVGLLSVAGFTVMAHRRQRALGMMGAIGATDRQVRRVMLANGTAVGTVGAAFGVLLGLIVWFTLHPVFENLVGHRIDVLTLPWWAVIAGTGLAVLTSLVAAWWPARAVARLPIVTALSGRPVPPQPAHRFALLGAALATAGFVLLVFSHETHKVQIVSGVLASTAGMLLLAPLGIRALATFAGHAPVSVRLALRDLARYQSRSGAAVAAGGLAVGIAAVIAISAAAQQSADTSASSGNLPSNQLIVWLDSPVNGPAGGGVAVAAPAPNGPSNLTPTAIATARRTAASIARSIGAAGPVELDIAALPTSEGPLFGGQPVDLVRPIDFKGHHGFTHVATAYIGTPQLLAQYGIAATSIEAGADILTSRHDLGGTDFAHDSTPALVPARIQATNRLPDYSSAPNTVILQHRVAAWSLVAQPAGWLLQLPHALTNAQIAKARGLAAAAGIAVETRSAPSETLPKLRNYATLVGTLLALGVLAMSVGLIRSETGNDLRTLAATGAAGHTRRTLSGATAAALGLLAGLLGTTGAYLALIAWHWHRVSYLAHPPYLNLAVLVVGLPLVAFIGGWLLGRTPASLARQALE
jgi:putative ABC transport system permease protein